jgi:hypothetical protein
LRRAAGTALRLYASGALQEERVMAVTWKTYNDRGKVVAEAQRLARTGQYLNYAAILPLLEKMEGFEAARTRLEEPAIRVQLDRLCAAARNPSASRVDFAAMRKSPEAKAARQGTRSLRW